MSKLADRTRDYPGHYFLETRQSPTHSWQPCSRDNDLEVMETRFEYQAERATAPGQAVRLTDAAGTAVKLKENP